MDRSAFQKLRAIAYEKAGIDLNDGKEALVAARVSKRLRALGLGNELEYVSFLASDKSGTELVEFLDAISTNFTSFFREGDHFEELKHFISERLHEGQRRFRIWSAACSSGEEPYTLAIVLAEMFGPSAIDWRILATDISTRVLDLAKRGMYAKEQVETVPTGLRSKYFVRLPGEDGREQFQVVPKLRERIVFQRLNLSTPPTPMNGPMHVVFCRNVMIYFDKRVRQGLVSDIERLLAPGGRLFISHTETLNGIATRLTMVRPSVYRKPEEGQ